jgi:hypothetical protein
VEVLARGIKACIIKQEVVMGMGEMLQLDASQSQDLDRTAETLQLLYSCIFQKM